MSNQQKISPSALETNTMAVAFLRQNKNKEAVSYFLQGLKHMLSSEANCVSSDDNDVLASPTQPCHDDSSGPIAPREEGSIHAVAAPDLRNTEAASSPDNVFSIFNRAIVVTPADDTSATAQSPEYKAIVTSVFMYNMGLAYHREGAEQGSSEMLRKAIDIYDMARKTLSTEKNQQANSSVYDLVMFALANNMGHIYSLFYHRQGAVECRRYLLQNISRFPGVLSPEDFATFSLNVMLSGDEMLQFAAAA